MSSSELDRLTQEHAKLHTAIQKMFDDNQVDENKLSVMKKHKLWLENKIQELESKQQQKI